MIYDNTSMVGVDQLALTVDAKHSTLATSPKAHTL
jgi:hypothetical protein